MIKKKSECGASLVEYSLLVALIAVVGMASLKAVEEQASINFIAATCSELVNTGISGCIDNCMLLIDAGPGGSNEHLADKVTPACEKMGAYY